MLGMARGSKNQKPTNVALHVSESGSPPAHDVLNRVADWAELAGGAYSKNTLRAWRADWAAFSAHCVQTRSVSLPASAATVRDFLMAKHPIDQSSDNSRLTRRSPATLKRYLATITRIHRASKLEDPCASEMVKLTMRAIARAAGTRQRQARAFGWSQLERFLRVDDESLRGARDRALVALAYDTLGRIDEISRIDVQHVISEGDGSGTLFIERSKTDQEAEGHYAFLSAATMEYIGVWCQRAEISSGPLWRIVRGKAVVLARRMSPAAIAATFGRAALLAGLTSPDSQSFSGHSLRVGATQDMLAAGISTAAVMQAGRWTDARMPARYGARVSAKRGAMAQIAAAQGRSRAK